MIHEYFSADNLSSKVEIFMLDRIKLTAHGPCEIRMTVKVLPADSALTETQRGGSQARLRSGAALSVIPVKTGIQTHHPPGYRFSTV